MVTYCESISTMAATMATTAASWWETRVKVIYSEQRQQQLQADVNRNVQSCIPKPLQPSQLCRPQWQQVQVDVKTQGLSYVFWNHGKRCCNCNNLMETTATLGASTAQSDESIWVMSSTSIDSVATMATTMTTTAKSWWKTGLSCVLRYHCDPMQPLQPQRRQFDGNSTWVELCIPKPLEPLQPRHNGKQFDRNVIWVKSSIPNPLQPQRQLQADQWNVWINPWVSKPLQLLLQPQRQQLQADERLSHDSIPKDHLATNGNYNNLMKHMDRVMNYSKTIVTIFTWLRLQRPGERTTSRRTHHHEFWAWRSKHI